MEDEQARAIPDMSVPDERKPPTACGRPGVYFQGPVVWCEECYGRLRSGEVPRVCEPWDSDPAPPNVRYKELFRAAEVLRLAGVTSENEIIPSLAFAARSFELTNLGVMRERFAQAGEDSAEWKVLEGTFRRAFDALEVVRVVDGVPIIFWKPFKLVRYPYEGTSVLEKVVIEVYLRSASIEGHLIVHLVGLNRSATSFCAYDANALVAGGWGSYAKLLDRSFLGSPLHFLCLSSDPNGDSLRLLLQGRVTAVSSTVTDTPALFSMGG